MARRRRKLRDRSQMMHRSLTASSSIRMTAIQMKAVRNSRRRMVVRGSTSACTNQSELSIVVGGPIRAQYCGGWTNQSSVFTCSPPSSSVTSSEQDSEAGNPMSGSSWY